MLRPTIHRPNRRPWNGIHRSQDGVVLILTLFVVLITYALVTQLTLGTEVAYRTSRNAADRVRLRAACTSAAEQVLQTLADDSSGSGGIGGFGGEGGPGFGDNMGDMASEAGFGNNSPGSLNDLGYSQQPSGEGGEEEGGEDDGSNADSHEDGWAKPMRIMMGDIEITSWIEDENAKFNLLTMISADEDYADSNRERCTRILDRLREDYEDDLNLNDARQITDRIVEWLEGTTRDEDVPRPPRMSNEEETDISLMYSLEELMMLEDVTPELFYDQIVDEDTIAPGLESIFTVWTYVDLAPPGSLEDDTGYVPPQVADDNQNRESQPPDPREMAEQQESTEESEEGEPNPSLGMTGAAQGEPALGFKININTAARAVLEGLMPPELLHYSVMEEIFEYRNEIDEEALGDEEELSDEEEDLMDALYGEERDDPKKYFKSMSDLDNIESLQNRVTQEGREEFLNLIDVQSDIFSVYLVARIRPDDWVPENRYEEPTGPVLRLRAIVWRRPTEDGSKFIFLQHWHEVPFTRWRIPDFQDRLEPFVPPSYF